MTDGNKTGGRPSTVGHHQVIRIWERLLGTCVSSIDESFFDLGGDSLLLPRMMEEVRQATGINVPVTSFLRSPTVRHLASCIAGAPRPNGMFTCIQEGAGALPFYFFHGDILGGGFYATRLCRLLGSERPFYVSPPIEIREHELPQVEELAARKRQALQKIQPHGPYILGGFCVGGVVAYEVARQLEAAGEEVRHVLLIEPEIGDALARLHLRLVNGIAARGRKPREKVQRFIRGLQKVDRLREVWCAPLREKTQFVFKKGLELFGRKQRDGGPEAAAISRDVQAGEREWLVSAYHWVLTSYVPKAYNGRVTVFSTNQLMEQAPYILQQLGKAAPRTRVERIAGEHLTCITHHLEGVGQKLKQEIERATTMGAVLLMHHGNEFTFL